MLWELLGVIAGLPLARRRAFGRMAADLSSGGSSPIIGGWLAIVDTTVTRTPSPQGARL
jgi:hypothetical protein